MKELTQFANVVGVPSDADNQDPQGSTQDWLLAEAIIANEPTSVLVEEGIILVQKLPMDVDEARFPVLRNTNFTWSIIDWRAATTVAGSDVAASAVNVIEYRRVRPQTRTANIFLPDGVSLVNKVSFDTYVQLVATEAKRQKEYDGLLRVMGSTANAETFTQRYAAGGFVSAGSVITGSTLTPLDLIKAKKTLMVGSNVHKPDFVLVHPHQYQQLNTHADFAPGAVNRGAMLRKAKFNEDGDIVKFDGMDVVVSELVPAGSVAADTAFVNAGHWALVGTRGKCGARAEHYGLRVSSEDHRRYHGTFKIFDMDYDHDILVDEANLLLRCADA
ncbi:MAG: hypothetical protein Q8O88_01380 [bacterium]|nr:hypothetical protein [bacterium]